MSVLVKRSYTCATLYATTIALSRKNLWRTKRAFLNTLCHNSQLIHDILCAENVPIFLPIYVVFFFFSISRIAHWSMKKKTFRSLINSNTFLPHSFITKCWFCFFFCLDFIMFAKEKCEDKHKIRARCTPWRNLYMKRAKPVHNNRFHFSKIDVQPWCTHDTYDVRGVHQAFSN